MSGGEPAPAPGHERRFGREPGFLRSPERLARLQVKRVAELSAAGLPGGGRTLDVGTGTGVFAEALARRGLAAAGIDLRPEMLAAARGFLPDGWFVRAVSEALPFAARSFELVFFGLVLHELDDPRLALAEARCVARARVAVLEWPYREQEFGPPLAHRLRGRVIESLAAAAGFTRFDHLPQDELDLYLME